MSTMPGMQLPTPGERQAPIADENGNLTTTTETTTEGQGAFGGFNTLEELVAAHEALKTGKAGEGGAEGDQGDKGNKPDGIDTDESDDEGEVADALKAAGLDQAVFTDEFAKTGTLSEESFKALEKAGFPRAMTEVYVAGLKAQQTAYNAAVYGPAGGEAGYVELIKWAKTGLTKQEIAAFNDAVGSGDPARAALAVQGAAAKKGGNKGKLLHGKAGENEGSVQPFRSLAEVSAAKNDPKYRRDPAFRAQVNERLAVSSF